MQKFSLGLALCVSLTLTACVSESSYVGSDRQVGERSLDNSEAARTRISLGLNYLRRGDTTQAKYNLERAKAFAPDLPEVYNALAFYYQSVGEHAQAEAAYQQALDKDSNNADAYNNYGAFLCQIGKYNEAEQLLLKAISRPGYIRVAESYENLALCQLDQQGFSKAKTFLESSVSHNGTRISSLINLAALNYAMGDNVEAKTALQRIQRLGRVSARSTLLNYLVAEKQGDVSTMKHAEQLLLTLYIDTPEARLLLQQRLLESEFEQLREQYKLSLMANIVLPEGTLTDVVPTGPVANPRLKVVRRKSPGQSTLEDDPVEQPVKTATETARTTTAASSVASQAIAGVLVTSPLPAADDAVATAQTAQQIADEQAATNASKLAQQQAAEQQALAEAETARQLTARQLAEQQATEKLAAEKLAAEKLAAEKQVADQLAASQLAEQQAAEPVAAEEPVADMASQPATRQQAADTEPPQTTFEQTADTESAQTSGQRSEQNNDSQLVLAATPPLSLPVETVLAESAIASAEATVDSPANVDNTVSDDVTDSIAQAETESAQPSAVSAATEPPAEFHIVQEGESLYAISVAHNIRLARLMEWNQLTPESVIKTGQRIWLAEVGDEQLQQQQTVARLTEFNEPLEATEPYHQVAAGETMFGISYRYNIRLERFMAWNDLTEQSKLQVGQQVLVIDPARIEP
ncbi:type IV pilus biogenesis/stability protein PilW [Arsukibacterium indicum]|nr:type IV pilus biogenesis/stability protein PilW [Arsukibacterium indicum]